MAGEIEDYGIVFVGFIRYFFDGLFHIAGRYHLTQIDLYIIESAIGLEGALHQSGILFAKSQRRDPRRVACIVGAKKHSHSFGLY